MTRTAGSAFLFLLIVLVTTVVAYVVQAERKMKTEGLYPDIKPLMQGTFIFNSDSVRIQMAEDPVWKRIVVYAYEQDGSQVGIVKPVYDRSITITAKDRPDFRVRTKGNRVMGFDILKKTHETLQGESFLAVLNEAKNGFRRFGLQECLYPICTRCMDVCPVIQHGVIEMPISENGGINPVVHLPGCPRCGKCFEVCKVGVLLNPSKAPANAKGIFVPDEQKVMDPSKGEDIPLKYYY